MVFLPKDNMFLQIFGLVIIKTKLLCNQLELFEKDNAPDNAR